MPILVSRTVKTRFTTLILSFFCLGVFSQNSYAMPQLPDLGTPDLVEYDSHTETELGKAFNTALHTEFDLFYDYEVSDYIRNLGHKIAAHSGQNRQFRFYVIDNPSINAFAGPNGIIGIHTGLISAVRNEDELASVIAHEIAHVTQQHLSRRYQYQSTTGNTTAVATFLAAILIGMIDPNAGMATLIGGQGLAIENQLKNSRQHENEADFTGIKILYDAGYNAHAMAGFFGRLSEASRNSGIRIPEILRTHPVTENRLAQAKNRAQTMIPFQPSIDTESLQLVQIRQEALRKNLDIYSNWKSKEHPCYQLNALQLDVPKPSSKNLSCLTKLADQNLMQTLYNDLVLERLTQLFLNNGKNLKNQNLQAMAKKALEVADFQTELKTQKTAQNFRAAKLLNAMNQPQQALQWLQRTNQNHPYQYARQTLMAEINNQIGTPASLIKAYIHQAKAQMDIGNDARGKHFIDSAQKQLNDKKISLGQSEFENIQRTIELFNSRYQGRLDRKPPQMPENQNISESL